MIKAEWHGFWQSISIDGNIITARVTVGQDRFDFRGLNGCPPGFSSILMEINKATGRKLFRDDWKRQEAESVHLKNDPFKNPEAAQKDFQELLEKGRLPFPKGE